MKYKHTYIHDIYINICFSQYLKGMIYAGTCMKDKTSTVSYYELHNKLSKFTELVEKSNKTDIT